MNKKKQFAQYFTPSSLASILVTRAMSFLASPPKNVLELAAGDGQLLISLLEIAPASTACAVDIDIDNIHSLKSKHPSFECIHFDALSEYLPIPKASFELALANPPFISDVTIDSYKQEIISKHLNINTKIGDKIRSEIIFICKYLEHLQDEKILSIILPSSLISGDRHQFFRSALLSNYKILEIYQVIDCDFVDTEADTYIITICNSKNISDKIPLKTINNKGEVINELEIEKLKIIDRMDPKYHLSTNNKGSTKLGDVASIKRGSSTHKELKSNEYNYIHTTNFNNNNIFSNKSQNSIETNKDTIKNGDVIICRVGKRIVGKTIEYKGPEVLFSDCIYRVRFSNNKHKVNFLKFVKSEAGKNEFMRLSKGVCSKYLTIGDMKNIKF
jgi:predicted RNA methylase